MKNRILIINPEGSFHVNPTLLAVYNLLVNNGFRITVLLPKSTISKRNSNLRQYNRLIERVKYHFIENFNNKYLEFVVFLINYTLLSFKKHDLIIGVDRQGIIESDLLTRFMRAKKVFFSFEIFFKDETSLNYKLREISVCQDVCFWLVQDVIRAALVSQENKLSKGHCFLCPVSPNRPKDFVKSSLKSDLGIGENQKVALYMGSISEMTMFHEIVETIITWPEDWVLLIHDKGGKIDRLGILDCLDENVKSLLNVKIFISGLDSVEFSNMHVLLSNCDVGLAFYQTIIGSKYLGKNVKYIGASSGKISTFLSYGIPIITNLRDWHAEMLTKFQYGIQIDEIADLGEALNLISNRKNEFHYGAEEMFSKVLNFELYESRLLYNFKKLLS